MDGVREFLESIRQNRLDKSHLRAVLHIAIGRKIQKSDGTVVSTGVTWRQLAEVLRVVRWDKEAVREIGLNPDDLPPRDRQRYWYQAISAAKVDSPAARAEADVLIPQLAAIGYQVI
jgi:hypothetical protein